MRVARTFMSQENRIMYISGYVYGRKIVLKGRTQLAIIINNECAPVARGDPLAMTLPFWGLRHDRDTRAVPVLPGVILW